MNGASKILTVSYGTFSCTLEGFEDPFNTMKAIAEYFRDLAAEDRYFGAEPPQPDAAMLHRIAEREIQRRVEAKIQDNGVILRAEDNEALSSRGPREHTTSGGADVRPQPTVEMPARSAAPVARPAPALAQDESNSTASAEAGTETVAEKLSRLRRAAAESQVSAPQLTAVIPLGVAEVNTALSSDMAAVEDHLPEDDTATAEEIVTGDLVPERQTLDLETFEDAIDSDDLGDLMALDLGRTEAFPLSDEPDHVPPSQNDTAYDVESERQDTAIAEQNLTSLEEDDEFLLASLAVETATLDTEDSQDHATSTTSTMVLAEEGHAEDVTSDDALLASLGALVDPEEDLAAEETYVAVHASRDMTQAAVDDAGVEPEEDSAEAQTVATESAADPALTEPGFDPAPRDDLMGSQDATEVAIQSVNDISDDQGSADDETPVAVVPVRPVRPVRSLRPTSYDPSVEAGIGKTEEKSRTIAEAESRTPVTVEKLQRARARVIKIRRSETPGAVELPPQATPNKTALSQEAEAALAAELAALEADSPEADGADSALASNPTPAPERRLGPPNDDVAVTRLMAEARTQMEVPDTKRRQSAIAHLKAAVAATIAERRATGSTLAGNGSERIGAYRDDLAKVVRPSATTSTERPAPLVLVSEQRIDRPVDAVRPTPVLAEASVRPSRPMTAAAPALVSDPDLDDAFDIDDDAENIFGADSGFPEFAERLGATDLPDLLEAAAAYIACVEGRDSFTRPQLMRHIGAASEGVSREDGLRSFGTLLREGVIERSRRGQFAISEASPILAEARKIAG